MKKVIYENNFSIHYKGHIEELKSQLYFIFSELNFIVDENVENLESIKEFEHVSNVYQRVYFSRSEIIYRPNSSNYEAKSLIFSMIKENSVHADEGFVKKCGKGALEVRIMKE